MTLVTREAMASMSALLMEPEDWLAGADEAWLTDEVADSLLAVEARGLDSSLAGGFADPASAEPLRVVIGRNATRFLRDSTVSRPAIRSRVIRTCATARSVGQQSAKSR